MYVAGHMGSVGSALVGPFSRSGCLWLVVATRPEVDLIDSQAVKRFLIKERHDANLSKHEPCE